MRWSATILWISWLCAAPGSAAEPVEWMMSLTLAGRRIEGRPLAWNDREVRLLGRDGRLWEFAPREASDLKRTSDRFQPYSPSEFRAVLLRELGQGYEVSGTGHYLVAHPKGRRDQWAGRFEELYRSFVHFASVRGLRLEEPPFPLVGVVCADREQFVRHAARQGLAASRGTLGYYCPESNRIWLYDVGAGAGNAAAWQVSASVLIHEATHQTAFNTGVHSRYGRPPLWVVEGLAMLFEAPGVYDGRHFTRPADRVNRERLGDFREMVLPVHRPELLADLVASDRFFQVSAGAAYAEAWALTYYLIETEPRKYAEYLGRTAARPPFAEYTAAERVADFTAVFGSDWRMLEARFLRRLRAVD